jgi:hypothetical protein
MSNQVAVAPSRAGPAHWIFFGVILILACTVVASITGEINGSTIGYGIGLTAIPAVIAFLVMSKGRNIVAGYAVFLVLISVISGREVYDKLEETKTSILRGCLERNPAVDALPEDQQKAFCGCYSDKLEGKVLLRISTIALSFSTPPASAADDPAFVSMATLAWNECKSQIGAN